MLLKILNCENMVDTFALKITQLTQYPRQDRQALLSVLDEFGKIMSARLVDQLDGF